MDQMSKTTKNDIKIIVVGNSGTGKTSFVNKWIKDTFDESYKATIVSEFSFKVIDYKDKSYKIQLWDLAGMDQNICITKIFSKDSHGCIVVSDITNEKTLPECVKWKNTVDETTKFLDGTNIEEAMNFLISNIIDRMDKIAQSGSNPFEKQRESLVLQKSKNSDNNKDNNMNGCC